MFWKEEKLLKVFGFEQEAKSPRREAVIMTGGLQV